MITTVLLLWCMYNLGKHNTVHESIRALRGLLTEMDTDLDVGYTILEGDGWEICWPEWVPFVAYRLKALICIVLLGRWQYGYKDAVEVAAYDIRPYRGEYSGTDWTAIRVGRGWFNWWYSTAWDSNV